MAIWRSVREVSIEFGELPLDEQYLILRTVDGDRVDRIARDLGLSELEYDDKLASLCQRLGIGSASQMLMWVLSRPEAARCLQELRDRGQVNSRPAPRLKRLVPSTRQGTG